MTSLSSMDFHLKQWRKESEQVVEDEEQQLKPSVKIPKLLLDSNTNQHSSTTAASTAALPFFVPDEPSCKISRLSAFSDSTQLPSVSESDSPATSSNTLRSFLKMGEVGGIGSYFSWAQRQELELQALIYKYMEMGASVPLELLQIITKSRLLHTSPYSPQQPFQHYSYYQPALLQKGYWGRAVMDPEPGRCRRTDGKKWRCSRDVVAGQKYCERHVHRGRNRSRKPVEVPTPASSSANTAAGMGIGGGGPPGGGSAFNTASSILESPLAAVNNGNYSTFCFAGQSSSTQFLHHNDTNTTINNGPSDTKTNRRDGRILRHFFDDWPRSGSDSNNVGNSQMNTATCLSISMPGNLASDVSLKLATGNKEETEGKRGNERELQQPQLNWNGGGGGWGTAQVASMGGPLAEALRSSTSASSPTSVLHHLPRVSASETSFVST